MARLLHTGRVRTVGVEEEFWLVDAATTAWPRRVEGASDRAEQGAPAAVAAGADGGRVRLVHEFWEEQLEAFTSPHSSMASLEVELRGWRARRPRRPSRPELGWWPAPRPRSRSSTPHRADGALRQDRERFGFVTRELLTCGCHVHVSVASPDEAIGVLDRIRVWLPVLLALSANSPFWQGHDTGYASFRHQVLGRWPVSGPTEVFGSVERYREVVAGLVATEVVLDEGMLYFDARRSPPLPNGRDQGARCLPGRARRRPHRRALLARWSRRAPQEWAAGDQPPPTPAALLRLATWQAARRGIEERLLDP